MIETRPIRSNTFFSLCSKSVPGTNIPWIFLSRVSHLTLNEDSSGWCVYAGSGNLLWNLHGEAFRGNPGDPPLQLHAA